MKKLLTYKNLKTLVDREGRPDVPLFFHESEEMIEVFSYEGPLVFMSVIYKKPHEVGGIDQNLEAQNLTDFNDNRRAAALDVS